MLEQGRIALKAGSDVYFVAGIGRLIGFVDGLKEGAAVSLEGTAWALPEGSPGQPRGAPPANSPYKFLRVNKLTIGGREYVISRP
jgi:hypothetical protein